MEVHSCFPIRKLIKRLFKTNHTRALTICLPSAAANSSHITSMPQVDRGGIHEDTVGNEVVKCSVRLPLSAQRTEAHAERPRRVRKCTVWVQAEAVDTRRGVRLKESAVVDSGLLLNTCMFHYQQFQWASLKGSSWTLLGYDRKTAFYFYHFVYANHLQYEQFGTKYQNVPMFIITSYVFIILSQFFLFLPNF